MTKRVLIPVSMALLITACTGNPVPTTHGLKVNVSGIDQAKVTVTNSTTKQVVFADTVTGSKTLADLPKDAVFTVEGAAVNGFQTPQMQTVTLSSDKETTLTYIPQVKPATYSLTIYISGSFARFTKIKVTDKNSGKIWFYGTVNNTGMAFVRDIPAGTVLILEGEPSDDSVTPKPVILNITENIDTSLNYVTPRFTVSNIAIPAGKTSYLDVGVRFADFEIASTGEVKATLSVADLPAEITAQPQDVLINEKGATVNIPLTVAAGISAGKTYSAQIIAKSEGRIIGRKSVAITVLP